jgi:hypothetical protein
MPSSSPLRTGRSTDDRTVPKRFVCTVTGTRTIASLALLGLPGQHVAGGGGHRGALVGAPERGHGHAGAVGRGELAVHGLPVRALPGLR